MKAQGSRLIRKLATRWEMHSRYWIWSVIALSVLICAMVSWMHLEHQSAIGQMLIKLENVRQARIDLGKGFLHLCLTGLPAAPYGKLEGSALLQQAVNAFKEENRGGFANAADAAAFSRSVAGFEASLSEWRKQDGLDPELTVALRLAFFDLENRANQLDTQAQYRLRKLTARMDKQFAVALGAAAFLLSAICVVVLYATKTKDRLAAAALSSENQLRESREFLADLVEHSGTMIFVKNPEGAYELVNRKWEEVTGMNRLSVMGKTDGELFSGKIADRFMQSDEEVRKTGACVEYEVDIDIDGVKRHFLTNKFPLWSQEHEFKGTCGITTEITERIRMENELRQTAEQKTALVKEIHHRVKNNLAIMSGLINLQARNIKHPEAASALADTKSRLRAMSLLHEILYSSGRMDRIEIGAYLDRLCMNLAQTLGAPARGIGIRTSSASLTLDINQAVPCGLIVSELVSNAVKHAFTGRTRGEVAVELAIHGQQSAVLTVADDGVGLPPDSVVEQSQSLGLTLVKTLTQQIGGVLVVRRPSGTLFEIRFPLPRNHSDPNETIQAINR